MTLTETRIETLAQYPQFPHVDSHESIDLDKVCRTRVELMANVFAGIAQDTRMPDVVRSSAHDYAAPFFADGLPNPTETANQFAYRAHRYTDSVANIIHKSSPQYFDSPTNLLDTTHITLVTLGIEAEHRAEAIFGMLENADIPANEQPLMNTPNRDLNKIQARLLHIADKEPNLPWTRLVEKFAKEAEFQIRFQLIEEQFLVSESVFPKTPNNDHRRRFFQGWLARAYQRTD